jgi:hypothetical protein
MMDISLVAIKKAFLGFISRYHMVLFAVIVIGGLALVVFMLNNIIISSSTSTDYTPAGTSFSFDQETIDRVNSLKSRDEAAEELDLSQGRTNPFIE